MIDVKKFVSAFLILAALTASGVLLVNFSGRMPAAPTAGSITQNGSVPTNAFAPESASLPNDASGGTDINAAITSDPNNLTNQLADSLLTNVITANPNGPQDDGSGDGLLTPPDPNAVIAGIDPNVYRKVTIPDWDFEAAMLSAHTSVAASNSDIAHYASDVSSILGDVNRQATAFDAQSTGEADLAALHSQTQTSIQKLASLTIPKDLASFHKNLVNVLVYQKNALALVESASNDPFRASLTLEAETPKYQVAAQKLQKAAQAAEASGVLSLLPKDSSNGENRLLAAVHSLIGIPTAHAFIVFDPIADAQTTITATQLILQIVKSALLQILKNTLITIIQNRVLGFIKNNGNPKFIQDWGRYVSDAFNLTAGGALGQIVPGLCNNFSPQVTRWLQNSFPGASIIPGGTSLNGAAGTNCSLQGVAANPNFYNNFSAAGPDAGFQGFISLLSPQNNPFGAFAEAHDEISFLSNAAAGATQNKAVSSGGFIGQEICGDGSTPSSVFTYCQVGHVNANGSSCVNSNGSTVGTPFRQRGCADSNQPFVTAPGRTIGDTLSNTLGANIHLVVNANDIIGLAATIGASLLEQFVAAGIHGLITTQPAGTGAVPTTAPSLPPLACIPSQLIASSSDVLVLSSTGGDGLNYDWVAFGGNPSSGSGVSFTTSFANPGTYSVTVTNVPAGASSQSASCAVTIQ